MKQLALIQNGIVKNVILADENFKAENYSNYNIVDVTDQRIGPNMTYSNGSFGPAEIPVTESDIPSFIMMKADDGTVVMVKMEKVLGSVDEYIPTTEKVI